MNRIQGKRIIIFTVLAFGLSWLLAAWLWLSGNHESGRFWTITLVLYMWGPAVANLLTRWFTAEGLSAASLRAGKTTLKYGAIAWFLTPVLIGIGGGVFFLFNPALFDAGMPILAPAVEQSGLSVSALLAIQVGTAVLLGPILNVIGTFGEEFGWRAYLQPKLLPLGELPAYLIVGVIWGLWHAPIIALGHNYGLGYFAAPWTGIAVMTLFTVVASVYIGWLTQRGGSVWPAVIAHGSLNAVAAVGVLFLANPALAQGLLGPLPAGLLGMTGFILAAMILSVIITRQTPE